METTRINASELCSRKLWQLVTTPAEETISDSELSEVIAELARRRHYLEELQDLGKLGDVIDC
jgi:heme oxygenase